MGAGSAGLLWYACCCSVVAFTGIIAAGLTVFGRMKDERARDAKQREQRERANAPASLPDSGADASAESATPPPSDV